VTVERQRNVFGFDVVLRVSVPEVVTLSPALRARLDHHVEVGLRGVCRRLAWHVIEWPKREAVLRRLSFDDAEALGLLPEWRKAKQEHEAAA